MKRIVSWILVIAVVFSMMPVAIAEEATETLEQGSSQTEVNAAALEVDSREEADVVVTVGDATISDMGGTVEVPVTVEFVNEDAIFDSFGLEFVFDDSNFVMSPSAGRKDPVIGTGNDTLCESVTGNDKLKTAAYADSSGYGIGLALVDKLETNILFYLKLDAVEGYLDGEYTLDVDIIDNLPSNFAYHSEGLDVLFVPGTITMTGGDNATTLTPIATVAPAEQSRTYGDGTSYTELTASYEVERKGEISYQWYKNDVAVEGAIDAAYTPADPAVGTTDTYYVAVSNTYKGSAYIGKSNVCTISCVKPEPSFPDFGFYTTPYISEESYSPCGIAIDENSRVFYFVAQEGCSLRDVKLDDALAEIASVEVSVDGSYATIRVMDTPEHNRAYSVSFSGTAWGEQFDGWDEEITLKNVGLYFRDIGWDEEGTLCEGSHNQDEWSVVKQCGCPVRFYYFNGESYEQLSIEDLDFDSKLVSLRQDETEDYIHMNGVEFGEGTIRYTRDEVTCVIDIRVILPNFGFYTSDTPSEEAYLCDDFLVTEDNCVFYFNALDGCTIDEFKFDGIQGVSAAERNADGSSIKITIDKDADFEGTLWVYYTGQENGREFDDNQWPVGITSGLSRLVFRHTWWDENSYVEDKGGQSSWSDAPGRCQGRFYFFDGETYTRVYASELTTGDAKVAYLEDSEDKELSYILAKNFGETKVEYTDAESSKTYSFPVSVVLPDWGFYSEPEAKEDNYLYGGFDVTEVGNVFYLVTTNDNETVTKISLDSDYEEIVDAEIILDGKGVKITVTGAPENRDYGMWISGTHGDNGTFERHCAITLFNVMPKLMYHYVGWDEAGNIVEGDCDETHFYCSKGYGAALRFYFFDGENCVLLSASDLVVSNDMVVLHEDENGVYHVMGNAFGEGTISYTAADGTGYSIAVTVGLPEFGWYTTPAATEEGYITEFTVDEDHTVIYLVGLDGYTIEECALQDGFGDIAAAEISDDGKYITVTITGTPENRQYSIKLRGTHESGRDFDWSTDIYLINALPGLVFRNTWWDEGKFVESEWTQSSWSDAPGRCQGRFYFFDGETYTRVYASALTTGDAEVAYLEDSEDKELSYILAKNFGETKVEYTDAESSKTYSFPISVVLPDWGFYGEPEAKEDNYLYGGFDVTEVGNVFYLVTTNDNETVTKLALDSDFEEIADAEIILDGKAVKITVTGAPENRDYGMWISGTHGDNGTFERHCAITLFNVMPKLMYHYVGWDENGNIVEEDYDECHWSCSKGSGAAVRFYFFDGKNCTRLHTNQLSASGVVSVGENADEDYTYLEALDFGTGSVNYTIDGVTYTISVTVELPELGFYSIPVPTESGFLRCLNVSENKSVFYLAGLEGWTIHKVELADGLEEIATVTVSENGDYAAIKVHGISENRGYSVQAYVESPYGWSDWWVMGIELVEAGSEADEHYSFKSVGVPSGNWNPHTWETDADLGVLDYVMAPLVDLTIKDSTTGEYQWIFVAAESITDVTAQHQGDLAKYGCAETEATEGYVYEIQLRPEMCWEDGTPINADTYIYSMQQMLSPELKNYRANAYYYGEAALAGAEAYFFQGSIAAIDNSLTGEIVQLTDLVKGEDGVYKTKDGLDVYIALTTGIDWLGGYSLAAYVNAYRGTYFDVDAYDALYALADENGNVAITDETWALLTAVISNPNWGEGPGYEVNYLYYEKQYEDASWDSVGLYKVDDYTIRYVCATAYDYYYFLTSCTSNWIVHEAMYEYCLESGLPYNGTVDTTVSCGPYTVETADEETMVLVRNEAYWEYDVDENGNIASTTFFEVDGEKVAQFITDRIVITSMNADEAKQAFLAGELDDWVPAAYDVVEYATSDQLYQVDETFTMRLFFHTNLDSLKAMDEAGNTNSVVLSNYKFRQAMSLAINRAEFVAVTEGYEAAYAMLNSLYYYDVYEDPTSIYRNTDQAKQAIVNLYGVEYGVGTSFATLDEAYASISGYNLDEAKALFTEACAELIAEGLYVAGDSVVIEMAWMAGAMDTTNRQQVALLNKYMNEALEGTGFGTIELKAVDNLSSRYEDVCNGVYAIGWGAWGGAAFYPFTMFRVYCDPSYVSYIHEGGCWDPASETLTLTINGDEVTMTWQQWSVSMIGTGKYANADNETKLAVLSALEENFLKLYYCIPICATTSCSMLSYKVDYYTKDYNIMYGFGGSRLMRFNYTDAEWEAYVQACGGELDYVGTCTEHVYGGWTHSKTATCTEAGYEVRECFKCDHYETREIAAKGHSYSEKVTAPTCTEKGYTTHACACGHSYVDNYVNATGHSYGSWTVTKAATCTEKGSEKRDCTKCDHYETQEIAAKGHSYSDTVTAATCTTQGYTTHTCACGHSYVDNYVNATGHSYGSWTVTKAATCTEKGSEKRSCSKCSHYETQETAAKGHSYSDTVTVATCTTQGYTAHTCACGHSYVDNYVTATGHSYGSWTVTKAATCTEKGSEKRSCSKCSHYETQEIAAKGHSYSDTVTVATCTTQGYTTHTCACGHSYVDNYVTATGHSYGDWTQTKAPTCTEKGSEKRSCSKCNHYETQEIAAKGHTKVKDAAVAATCTKTGLTEGEHCSVCNAVLVAQKEVAAKGHTWLEATYEAPMTCSVCNATKGDPLVRPVDVNKDVEVETSTPEGSDVSHEEAEEAVESVLESAGCVAQPEDTGIEANKEVIEAAKEQVKDENGQAVDSEKIDSYDTSLKITMQEAVVDKQGDNVVAKRVSYDITPYLYALDEDGAVLGQAELNNFDTEITFRLPIHKDTTSSVARVWHNDEELEPREILVDENGNKYIEVKTKSFSVFTTEIHDHAYAESSTAFQWTADFGCATVDYACTECSHSGTAECTVTCEVVNGALVFTAGCQNNKDGMNLTSTQTIRVVTNGTKRVLCLSLYGEETAAHMKMMVAAYSADGRLTGVQFVDPVAAETDITVNGDVIKVFFLDPETNTPLWANLG